MKLNELDKDEVILYESKNLKNETITLTNKKIIIEKPKHLFTKKQKINLENIKIYKDKVQIKQKTTKLIITTIDKNIEYNCKNVIEAKKIIEQIITLKTGKNIIDRTTNKTIKITKNLKNIALVTAAIASAPSAIKQIKQNGKKILQILVNLSKR